MSDTDPYGAPGIEYSRHGVIASNNKVAEAPTTTSVQTPEPSVAPVVAADGTEPEEVALEVPEGTVAAVMEWVGTSTDRARAALEAEKSGKDRASLITKLEEILN